MSLHATHAAIMAAHVQAEAEARAQARASRLAPVRLRTWQAFEAEAWPNVAESYCEAEAACGLYCAQAEARACEAWQAIAYAAEAEAEAVLLADAYAAEAA